MSSFLQSTTRVRIETTSLFRAAPRDRCATTTLVTSRGGSVFSHETGPAAPPHATDDAIRLAIRLREYPSAVNGRTLMIAPLNGGAGVDRLVAETALGLAHLGERVVIVDLDLGGVDDALLKQFPPLPCDHEAELPLLSRFSPADGIRSTVRYLASDDFSRFMERLRTRSAFTLCIGQAVPNSVETLLVARRCDAMVLSVTEGQTTISQVQESVTDLRRRNQPVLGFVMNAGSRKASQRSGLFT